MVVSENLAGGLWARGMVLSKRAQQGEMAGGDVHS